jgi:hypothetical protein
MWHCKKIEAPVERSLIAHCGQPVAQDIRKRFPMSLGASCRSGESRDEKFRRCPNSAHYAGFSFCRNWIAASSIDGASSALICTQGSGLNELNAYVSARFVYAALQLELPLFARARHRSARGRVYAADF